MVVKLNLDSGVPPKGTGICLLLSKVKPRVYPPVLCTNRLFLRHGGGVRSDRVLGGFLSLLPLGRVTRHRSTRTSK